jgi:putative ABC transport system substrate-binding protein
MDRERRLGRAHRPNGKVVHFAESGPFAELTPEILESLLAQFGIAGGVLDGAVAEPILNGPRVVVQSSKFEFIINLKAAKALGIEVPPNLSAEADEIIE